MNSATRTIVIGIVIIIVVLLGYFAWQERTTTPATISPTATSTSSTSTGTTINVSSTGSATTTGGYTITPITGPAAPSYKTPLTYPANMDPSEESQDQSQFEAIQVALAANPNNLQAWLGLAALREGLGDYTGAGADWKYLTEIYPTDPTAFANLGDLYANYLHQPTQGIAYYKQAIKVDPKTEETFYDDLAQIYVAEGDTADAKATLQQGITAQVVGYQNLQNELNSIQ